MSEKGEDDVARDPQVASSRATGGTEMVNDADQASTTGTSNTPEYVGRIAGDDVGYAGETGAERRAEASRGGEPTSDAPSNPDDDSAPAAP
jgi:hypothetical protein